MEDFVFTHTNAGMTALMVLIAIVTTDIAEGAIVGNAHLVDKTNAQALALENRLPGGW